MGRFSHLEFEGKGKQAKPKESAHYLDQDKDDKFYLAQAEQLFRDGKFEKALRMYSRTLELNPEVFDAWFGQVQMLLELDELNEANLWADKALEKFKNHAKLIAAKAVAHARMGDIDKALDFSDASLKSEGSSSYLWLARGEILLVSRRHNYEYCFWKAVNENEKRGDWFVYLRIGRIYKYHQKFAQAMRELEKACQINAASVFLWYEKGFAQLGLGMQNNAISSFKRALEMDAQCQEAQEGLKEAQNLSLGMVIRGWFRWLR